MDIFTKLKGYDKVFSSESGRFLCLDGIVQEFIPEKHNVIKEYVDLPKAFLLDSSTYYKMVVKTMIVPNGVKGFCDGFFDCGAVTDVFRLPDSLTSIGSNDVPGSFCGCYLPEVILPENLRFIGKYAFSSSYIEKLVVRASNESPYLRQFKDSTIKKVYLPFSIKDSKLGEEREFIRNFYNHCKCEIIYY